MSTIKTFREEIVENIEASPEFARAFLDQIIKEFSINLKSGVTGRDIALDKLTSQQVQEVALLFIEKHPKGGPNVARLITNES